MENNEEIYRFDNLDVIDYINTKHLVIDFIEIESEMNTQKALLKRIDESLYEFFLQSSDSLLSLLDTYKECLGILKNFKTETKAHIDLQENTPFSEELLKKFALFKDDMNIFLTEERYYVYSNVFNEGSIICLLTNDLLFIGEKDKGNLFKLKRSVPKQAVKMIKKEKDLEIILENGVLGLKGDANQIEDLYESFKEISYSLKRIEKEINNVDLDLNLINFYIETENFIELMTYLEINKQNKGNEFIECNVIDKISVFNDGSIRCIMKFGKNPLETCKPFLKNRLLEGLNQVNQIQEFALFMGDVFSLLNDFCVSLEKFFKENNLPERKLILFIEECVIMTLKRFESRIAMHSKVLGNKDALELIASRLEFLNFNFKYLISDVMNCPYQGTEKMLSRAKEAILNEVKEFLSA